MTYGMKQMKGFVGIVSLAFCMLLSTTTYPQTRSSLWLGSRWDPTNSSFQLGQLNANLGQLNANLSQPRGMTFFVTNTNDAGPGSLRDAIEMANARPGHDTVSIANIGDQTVRQGQAVTVNLSSYGMPALDAFHSQGGLITSLTGGEISITDSLTINGPGRDRFMISGHASPGNRLFNIASPDGSQITVNLIGVTCGLSKLLESLGRDDADPRGKRPDTQGKLLESLGRGGALFANNAIVNIHQSAIVASEATVGGGIYLESGILNISESVVEGNSATEAGGGVALGASSEMYVTTSLISGNSAADSGSGISTEGDLTVINSTITGNVAPPSGEAIRSFYIDETGLTVNAPDAPEVYLINSTISHNTGYGFRNLGIFAVSMGNTIVAHNSSETGADLSGEFYSFGGNLVRRVKAEMYSEFSANQGDIVGTDQQPVDPRLGPLQDNGGATMTRALFGNSPAIDKANNCIATAFSNGGCMPFAVTNDQRLADGFSRVMNGRVDIGAYENNHVTPPTDKLQCQAGGWQYFYNPRVFRNQGDCIQFVNTGK